MVVPRHPPNPTKEIAIIEVTPTTSPAIVRGKTDDKD